MTPGPWEWDDAGEGSHRFEVFAEGREHHAKVTNEADARFIAAAPDLLRELQMVGRQCPDDADLADCLDDTLLDIPLTVRQVRAIWAAIRNAGQSVSH